MATIKTADLRPGMVVVGHGANSNPDYSSAAMCDPVTILAIEPAGPGFYRITGREEDGTVNVSHDPFPGDFLVRIR